MMFHVTVRIEFVDGSSIDDAIITVHAESEEDAGRLVTPELMMENLGGYWGPPIANVTVLSTTRI
jgi:hypothetical protein